MELNLSTRLCMIIMKALEYFIERQFQGLHRRTALSKDGTELLSRLLRQCYYLPRHRCFFRLKLLLLLVTPRTDPLFTRVTTKPYMSSCTIRSLISHSSGSLVLFVTLQMTARILENYNQRLIFEFSLAMHQAEKLTKQMAPVQSSPGPAPNLLTPTPISSGLVPNPAPAIPYVPPTNKELEMLFQPMFDEYFNPPGTMTPETVRVLNRPVSSVSPYSNPCQNSKQFQYPVNTTLTTLLLILPLESQECTPSPSPLTPSHLPALQSTPSSNQGNLGCWISTLIERPIFAPVDNNPFVNVFALEPSSEASSFGDVSLAASTHVSQPHHHLKKIEQGSPA
ncbi:hypothetical protein Tco_0846580 [Tanacetum coccineum]